MKAESTALLHARSFENASQAPKGDLRVAQGATRRSRGWRISSARVASDRALRMNEIGLHFYFAVSPGLHFYFAVFPGLGFYFAAFPRLLCAETRAAPAAPAAPQNIALAGGATCH